MEIKARDLVAGIPKTMKISSVEVREALSEPLQQIVDALMQSLEKTPPELASDIVDRGIVMTGGGSLLRGIDMLLREATNLPITVAEDPLTCVVPGTERIPDAPPLKKRVLLSVLRAGGGGERPVFPVFFPPPRRLGGLHDCLRSIPYPDAP